MATAKRQEIEIRLQALAMTVTGSTGGRAAKSRHALTVELIWPRNGFQIRGYTRIVELVKGACAYTDADWLDAVLMKETVLGRFGLRVRVSQALSDTVVAKILRATAKVAATSVGDALEKSLDKPIGKTLSAPVDYIASLFADEAVPPIGGAERVVDPEFFSSGDGVLTLPLHAPMPLTKAQASVGKTRRPRRTLLAKDAPNGEIALMIGRL